MTDWWDRQTDGYEDIDGDIGDRRILLVDKKRIMNRSLIPKLEQKKLTYPWMCKLFKR